LVAFAMGAGVTLPHVFLRAYTAELNIPSIRTFFLIYAAMAFTFRITTRKMSETHGVRAMVVLGLSLLAASMVAHLAVFHEWLLALPAILGGMAHALLFPAVVGGGSTTFPRRYRGLGTTLMLAMFDLGSLFGQPFVGGLLEGSRRLGLPPYPAMFLTLAVGLVAVAATFYAATLKPGSRAAQACRLG
jgi:hypothetical protein